MCVCVRVHACVCVCDVDLSVLEMFSQHYEKHSSVM